jgi:electron transfer flavoprotein alpha subunit
MSGILVVTEQNSGAWHKMSWEALAAGQQLGRELAQPVHACVFGKGIEALLAELAGCELASAIGLEHELLADYTADGATSALEWLIERLKPAYVIFPHTYQVRDFGPKLATRCGRVLLSDVIAFRVADGGVTLERQLFQGKLNADYVVVGDGPTFFSIQAGAFRPEGLVKGKAAESSTLAPPIEAASIRQQPEAPFRESARAVDLSTAELIVAVGRGIQEESNIPLVRDLADALGAELAASRPICDNAWLPMERQVGSSGQTVSPKLYLAVGISGAIQHLVGMKGSKCVVAINKDSNAPIFEIADYGIAGDLFEVVPALTEAVKKARG